MVKSQLERNQEQYFITLRPWWLLILLELVLLEYLYYKIMMSTYNLTRFFSWLLFPEIGSGKQILPA